MAKISEFPTKTTPVGADKLTGFDSETSDISLQNKNFTLSSLWSAIFGSRTTSDIPEGSNLYYTNARTLNVAVGNTGDETIAGIKTFSSSPIVPTPTTDFQASTKKYVDDKSVSIDPLPEDTVGDMEADFFVKSDGVTNEKILISRYRASEVEATEGTSTTKFMTPKNVKDNYSFKISTASATIIEQETTEYLTTSSSLVPVGVIIQCMFHGTIRVVYDAQHQSGFGGVFNIYINGGAVGTQRLMSSGDPYTTWTEDINVNFGDKIQIYASLGRIRNFSVRGTFTPGNLYTYKF